jgi:hypothetical protein
MRLFEVDYRATGEIEATQLKNRAYNFITTKCGQALAECRKAKKVLYRGLDAKPHYTPEEIFISQPTTNRRPMSSPKDTQAAFDKIMSERGFKALRGNSIFCTSDKFFAAGYGSPFIIFPVDGFSFTWSKRHADVVLPPLNHVEMDVTRDVISSLRRLLLLQKLSDSQQEFLWDVGRAHGAPLTASTIVKLGELAVEVGVYPKLSNEIKAAIKSAKNGPLTIEHAIDNYEFQNTNFGAALKSGHEILINSEYIAIKAEHAKNIGLMAALGRMK